MMELNVTRRGETEKGVALEIGQVVRYIAHLPGGMVKIEMPDKTQDEAHPACFKELN